jgi:UDP-2,3-diacylglucosamine pyrophosphatase LpxH
MLSSSAIDDEECACTQTARAQRADLRLASRHAGCQAFAVLDFLRHVECETLFLVGDIFDGWQLRRSWYWPQQARVSYVGDFEQAVAREARPRGAHRLVCGHIHHAELRDIGGILYANDGDWVESLTALVEHADGRLEIVDCSASTLRPMCS